MLWRVSAFGRQRVAAGQAYWWQNAARQPAGRVVVQVTLAGAVHYHDHPAGQGDRTLGPGDLMLCVYGEPSAYGQPAGPLAQPYACHWLCLDGVGLVDHVQAFRDRFGSVRTLGPRHPLLAELDELIATAESPTAVPSTAAAASVHSFIMHLFEEAEQSRIQQLSPTQRALDFMLRQPGRVVNLEAVARQFACSREHLSRLFREQVGQPPHAYLNAARTRRSLRLLRNTDLPLNEIAAQAGFPSTKTMARHIRRTTGQTPGRLRG